MPVEIDRGLFAEPMVPWMWLEQNGKRESVYTYQFSYVPPGHRAVVLTNFVFPPGSERAVVPFDQRDYDRHVPIRIEERKHLALYLVETGKLLGVTAPWSHALLAEARS
jgi:hypothetical protein